MLEVVPDYDIVRWPTHPQDRVVFGEMWSEYLVELHKLGGEQLPTRRTLDFYLNLFDQYMDDPSRGAVYFVGDPPMGVILWGGPVELPWDHTLGRIAQGWGTYVRPGERGMGLSTALRNRAAGHLRQSGFDCVLGSGHHTNEVGIATGDSYGFEPLHDTRVLRL